MAKMTLQNLQKDHFTCEECGGILKDFDGASSEHGGINADIPCPRAMNAVDSYGIAKDCTYEQEDQTEEC